LQAEQPYFVYVLENAVGRFYVGHTGDLARRVSEHNDPLAPGVKFAPKNGPWRLVWSEELPNRASAMIRERQIKAMKSARWIRRELLGCSGC
jgi:predicted GIY-YIG superfamily endonuclease